MYLNKRASGILMHITSLPSSDGIGDFGPEAYKFADFLKSSGQSFWQVLPFTCTDQAHGHSPYSSVSAFAGNPLFISSEMLFKDNLLEKKFLNTSHFPENKINYPNIAVLKTKMLNEAYKNFKKLNNLEEFELFCKDNAYWLDDFSLFIVLKSIFKGSSWMNWPKKLKNRDKDALLEASKKNHEKIEYEKFVQFVFFKQWLSLKNYCNEKSIQIIGDIPFYVSGDSADLWTHPDLFKLNKNKRPLFVAGVPPDYFSKTGQLWGNPVYDWEKMHNTGYSWWIKRLEQNFKLFDIVRIDHFRGFSAYWEVPSKYKTAIKGRWINTPGHDFFKTLLKHFKNLPVIAEDLGIITNDVKKLMHDFNLMGMKVMLFAFGEDFPNGAYVPSNFIENCIAYTGTHDNNTVKGWFEKDASTAEKKRLFSYINKKINSEEVSNVFIELAINSRAKITIFPMQDILGLGAEARMNVPSTNQKNWEWRLSKNYLTSSLTEYLRTITHSSQRSLLDERN